MAGRSRKASDAPRFRIWPPVAFAVPFLLGLGASWWLGDPVVLPRWSGLAGLVLLILAVPWDAWALWGLLSRRTALLPGSPTTTLVVTGPFALSRNPLYVGFVLLHGGLALVLGSVWALAALPVAILAVLWGAILPEEAYLARKFGRDYAQYRARVRRWI